MITSAAGCQRAQPRPPAGPMARLPFKLGPPRMHPIPLYRRGTIFGFPCCRGSSPFLASGGSAPRKLQLVLALLVGGGVVSLVPLLDAGRPALFNWGRSLADQGDNLVSPCTQPLWLFEGCFCFRFKLGTQHSPARGSERRPANGTMRMIGTGGGRGMMAAHATGTGGAGTGAFLRLGASPRGGAPCTRDGSHPAAFSQPQQPTPSTLMRALSRARPPAWKPASLVANPAFFCPASRIPSNNDSTRGGLRDGGGVREGGKVPQLIKSNQHLLFGAPWRSITSQGIGTKGPARDRSSERRTSRSREPDRSSSVPHFRL